jgi:hypothetical protein
MARMRPYWSGSLGWSAVAGPDYWKFEGKTLSELREEKASQTED